MSALSARPASHGRPRESSHHARATAATTIRLTCPKRTPTNTGSSTAAPKPYMSRTILRPGAVRYQTNTKAAARSPVQIQAASG